MERIKKNRIEYVECVEGCRIGRGEYFYKILKYDDGVVVSQNTPNYTLCRKCFKEKVLDNFAFRIGADSKIKISQDCVFGDSPGMKIFYNMVIGIATGNGCWGICDTLFRVCEKCFKEVEKVINKKEVKNVFTRRRFKPFST